MKRLSSKRTVQEVLLEAMKGKLKKKGGRKWSL
jgi:hypothetical protein